MTKVGARSPPARSPSKEVADAGAQGPEDVLDAFRGCTRGDKVRRSFRGSLLEYLSGKDPRVCQEGEEPASLTRLFYPCLHPKK